MTEFMDNLEKFHISNKKETGYPREAILDESGFYNNPKIPKDIKEKVFDLTYKLDHADNERDYKIRSGIMDIFSSSPNATERSQERINLQNQRTEAFEALNYSLKKAGKPTKTREQFERESPITNHERFAEPYITKQGKIYPKKPTALDRLRIIKAKQGYRGIVKHPTIFLAGEAGPEHVDIEPEQQADIYDWGFSFGNQKQGSMFPPMQADFSIINYAMNMAGIEQQHHGPEMNIFNSIMGESVAPRKGKHKDDEENYDLLDMVESWY